MKTIGPFNSQPENFRNSVEELVAGYKDFLPFVTLLAITAIFRKTQNPMTPIIVISLLDAKICLIYWKINIKLGFNLDSLIVLTKTVMASIVSIFATERLLKIEVGKEHAFDLGISLSIYALTLGVYFITQESLGPRRAREKLAATPRFQGVSDL